MRDVANGERNAYGSGLYSSSPNSRRAGGGGEPIRRADGSIVANLRTMKRTANPNLPLRVDDDRSDSYNNSPPPGKPPAALGVNDLDQVGYFGGDLQGQGDSTPRYNRHVLFSHAYDSPEEVRI